MPARLSDYFQGIASKYLSSVETSPDRSNQHEFNGSGSLRAIFGNDRQEFEGAKFIYLSDDPADTYEETGNVTWYDARENHPSRTEYRLYYTGNLVMDYASSDDLLIIGLRPDRTLYIFIAEYGSQAEAELAWLLNTPEDQNRFLTLDTSEQEMGFVEKYIISQLELPPEAAEVPVNVLEEVINRFGHQFPSTTDFTNFTWAMFPDLVSDDPDQTLLAYIDKEETIFKVFEEHLIRERLRQGFDSVIEFENFAKSWINRRYSRAGHSLENHLEIIFRRASIRFDKNKATENRKRPDFIFPSIDAYRSLPNQAVLQVVTMLGAKRSCKDRWRQVLSEANRLTEKHLLTIEPGISINQTDEMQAGGLRLVVPAEIHRTYRNNQHDWLMNLAEFMDLVLHRQNHELAR